MPEMQSRPGAASHGNGASTPHDLFVLTDEQILEIDPDGEVNVGPSFSPASPTPHGQDNSAAPAVISSEAQRSERSLFGNGRDKEQRDSSVASLPRNDRPKQGPSGPMGHATWDTGRDAQPGVAVLPEPPPWLAAQMKDPWSGEEAKEFWNGVQQARSEAAAYRAAFPSPEDARALKELYPGGVNEARAAANRAQLLEEIDRAYFGVPGGSAEQTSATRVDLAQRMLREDPAAFREMVFAGLRALEEAEKGSAGSANSSDLPRLAKVLGTPAEGVNVAPPFRVASTIATAQASNQDAEVKPSHTQVLHESPVTSHQSLVLAYSAFEKAANEDLERSVGSAISQTIQQALPNLQRRDDRGPAGARFTVPLQERLGAAVRQDVEAALKGDRQLGEQIAQILSARRFDNETRAQVVRLIDDRARQLVPSAARRVINDWTQTTLAAHRGKASRTDVATARREVEPVAAQGLPGQVGVSPAVSSHAAHTRPGAGSHGNAKRSDARRVDYRKLSDEQILDL